MKGQALVQEPGGCARLGWANGETSSEHMALRGNTIGGGAVTAVGGVGRVALRASYREITVRSATAMTEHELTSSPERNCNS